MNDEWSEKSVVMYCVVNYISKNGQDKIIQYVKNCITLKI